MKGRPAEQPSEEDGRRNGLAALRPALSPSATLRAHGTHAYKM